MQLMVVLGIMGVYLAGKYAQLQNSSSGSDTFHRHIKVLGGVGCHACLFYSCTSQAQKHVQSDISYICPLQPTVENKSGDLPRSSAHLFKFPVLCECCCFPIILLSGCPSHL